MISRFARVGFLCPRLKRLGVVRRGGAKPVSRDRTSGRQYTTVSHRTAICQHQCGNKECNALEIMVTV
jgi:hypothetical protein